MSSVEILPGMHTDCRSINFSFRGGTSAQAERVTAGWSVVAGSHIPLHLTTEGGVGTIEGIYREASDLILTDVMMPGLSGMELWIEAKKWAVTGTAPVIILGQAWSHWGIQRGSAERVFQWFPDVAGQALLHLAAEIQRYPIRRTRRDTELRWLEEHSAKLRDLAGRWLAINGNELISQGETPKEALEIARQRGVDQPLLFHVPDADVDISFAAFD